MDIKQILRLLNEGKSQRYISKALNIHRRVVVKYQKIVEDIGLPIPAILEMDDSALNKLFPDKKVAKSAQQLELEEFFAGYKADHKYTGFTIENHYKTYLENVADGLSRSQFYTHFRTVFKPPKGSLRIEHSYGQKLFIDFAGKPMHIIDKATGELMPVKVFVGIMPASQYMYVQAVLSESLADVTDCTTKCLDFIGGVPQSITTDNLKAAVTKASKTEPVLNKSFKDLANHYSTTITPTRAYSPKDKAMVEAAVRITYCSVYFNLRHRQFFSLQSLNEAIKLELDILNHRKLSNKQVSRYDQYLEEKATLKALPNTAFELWEYRHLTVQKMGYVLASKFKNYYSIPYKYIGHKIQIRTNARCLQAFYNDELIATHLLSNKLGSYTTIKEHLHSDNQFYANWSPDYFASLAKKIGAHTEAYVTKMIAQSSYPETAYKSAIAIINLKRDYEIKRIETACQMGLNYLEKNCGVLKQILENKADLVQQPVAPDTSMANIVHDNVRGAQYYYNVIQ